MRNGRFVLPVGDEGAQLHLYVTQLGNVQPPRVFPTLPFAPDTIFAAVQARPTVLPSYASANSCDLLPDSPRDIVRYP